MADIGLVYPSVTKAEHFKHAGLVSQKAIALNITLRWLQRRRFAQDKLWHWYRAYRDERGKDRMAETLRVTAPGRRSDDIAISATQSRIRANTSF